MIEGALTLGAYIALLGAIGTIGNYLLDRLENRR